MAMLSRQLPYTPVPAERLNEHAKEIERVATGVFGDPTTTAKPIVVVRRTTTQTLTNGTNTVAVWQTFETDAGGMWDPGTPDRLTVITPGLWLWVAQLRHPPVNTTGIRAGKIMINGTNVNTNSIASGSQPAVSSGEGNTIQIVGRPLGVVAGDAMYVNAFQSSGGSTTLDTDFGGTWFGGVWLGL